MIYAKLPPLGLVTYSPAVQLGLVTYSPAVQLGGPLGQAFIDIQGLIRQFNSMPLPWSYDDARTILADALPIAQTANDEGQGLPNAAKRATILGKLQFHNNVLNSVDTDQHSAAYSGSWDLAQWAQAAAIEYNSVLASQDTMSYIAILQRDLAALANKPGQYIQSQVAQAAQQLATQVNQALSTAQQDLVDAAADASNNFIAANAAHPFQVQFNVGQVVLAAAGVVAVAGLAYLVYRAISKA